MLPACEAAAAWSRACILQQAAGSCICSSHAGRVLLFAADNRGPLPQQRHATGPHLCGLLQQRGAGLGDSRQRPVRRRVGGGRWLMRGEACVPRRCRRQVPGDPCGSSAGAMAGMGIAQ